MTRSGRKWLSIGAATVAALAGIVLWALEPILTGGSFLGNNDVEIVHRYFPVHVVPPEWIHTKGILLMDWILVETRVRFFIVLALWVVLLVFILYRSRRNVRPVQT